MSIFNPSNIILTALQYAPAITVAMQQVEATALPGETKKAVILASIEAAAKVGEQVPEAHVQMVSALIDLLAGLLFPAHKPAVVEPAK